MGKVNSLFQDEEIKKVEVEARRLAALFLDNAFDVQTRADWIDDNWQDFEDAAIDNLTKEEEYYE